MSVGVAESAFHQPTHPQVGSATIIPSLGLEKEGWTAGESGYDA